MGYFDAIVGSSFKRTADGRTAFYPWGVLGAGYVLTDEKTHRGIRALLRRYYVVSLPLIPAVGLLFGWSKAFLLLPLLIGFYVFAVRRHLRGLTRTGERLTLIESYRQQAKGHNLAAVWVFEVASLVFVAAGTLILVADTGNWFVGAGSIGFFGLCAIVFGFMIQARGKD